MMVKKDILFDLDDILIQPVGLSTVNSRCAVSVVDVYGMLPLFTAPMDTVVDETNYELFNKLGIYTIIPRKADHFYTQDYVSFDKRNWFSYGISDFEKCFIHHQQNTDKKMYALIDIANGHMNRLYELVREAKLIYGDKLMLMVGNVANPETYVNLSKVGADYIRCGVGNGGGCLTTQHTGIGYPMGSLIEHIYEESTRIDSPAFIIADGGMKNYSDIIKCLALGADYVMVGSIFNKTVESAGETYINGGLSGFSKPDLEEDLLPLLEKSLLFKKFRGMSTKEVQNSLNRNTINTSEGVVKYQQVEYTLGGWVENFEHYLRTAMSYTNSFDMYDFIGRVKINLISDNAHRRFNK